VGYFYKLSVSIHYRYFEATGTFNRVFNKLKFNLKAILLQLEVVFTYIQLQKLSLLINQLPLVLIFLSNLFEAVKRINKLICSQLVKYTYKQISYWNRTSGWTHFTRCRTCSFYFEWHWKRSVYSTAIEKGNFSKIVQYALLIIITEATNRHGIINMYPLAEFFSHFLYCNLMAETKF
jgi:hypothetical protein